MGMDIQPAYTDQIWRVRARFGEAKEQARNVLQTVQQEFEAAGCPLQLIVIILEKKERDGPYGK